MRTFRIMQLLTEKQGLPGSASLGIIFYRLEINI